MTQASLAFARLSPKVDFGAPDGPADLVFLIAAPAHGDADHLTLLTALARALVRPEFVASLRAATSDEEIVRLVDEVVSPARRARGRRPPPAAPAPAAAADRRGRAPKSVVVVSACPTGIAHTYMAADKLTAAGEAAGRRRARGDAGLLRVDPARPGGHPGRRRGDLRRRRRACGTRTGSPASRSCSRGTKRAINEPDVMIREALAAADDPNARRVAGGAAARPTAPAPPRPAAGRAPARRSAAGCSPASAT